MRPSHSIAWIILSIILTFTFNSCKDSNEINEPELKFELAQNPISFEAKGQEIKVQLTANTEWSIENIPSWLAIEPTSGSQSTEIIITCEPNESMDKKNANILFVSTEKNIECKISQAGITREDLLGLGGLSGTRIISADYKLGPDNKERIYDLKYSQLYINPLLKDKVFLGAMIDSKMKSNGDVTVFSDYKLYPITVISTTAYQIGDSTFIPSIAAQEEYAQRVIDSKPKQIESFSSSSTEFHSYRQLHLIGMGNIGIKLDEVMNGESYQEKEMGKKNGLIFSYYLSVFSIIMDLPENGRVTEDILKAEDFPNQSLAYIDKISYGRMGMLIVESDNEIPLMRSIVNRIKSGETLTEEEKIIANEIKACHVFFDKNNKIHVENGQADVIKAYSERGNNKYMYDVYPISCGMLNYFELSTEHPSFSFKLP